MTDLKRRMARGAAWMVLLRLADRGIGLVSTLILVRLLVPGDFGLIAMATTMIAALELLAAYSFETALIQNQKADRSHYDTAFTLNLLLGLTKSALIAALAWVTADFYDEPRLIPVMLALSVVTAVQAFENIGIVDFQKHLDFRREFILSITRRLFGFVTTISLAWWLQSYWALLGGMAMIRVVSLLMSYTMSPYRPGLALSRAGELFSYTKWLLLNNVLLFLNNRGADFVIGRMSGAHALGLYSVSYELANLPTTELVFPIQRAVFPGYSQMANDLPRLREAFLDVLGLIALLTVPAGLLIGVLAEPFVLALLGAGWVEAVPLVEVLAVFGVLRSFNGPAGSVYLAVGRPRAIAYLSALSLVIAVGLSILWVPLFGVIGVAWAILVGASVNLMVNYAKLFRLIELDPKVLLRRVWRPLVAGASMWAALYAIQHGQGSPSGSIAAAVELAVLGIAGLAGYAAFVAAAWRRAGRPAGAESTLVEVIRARLRSGSAKV
jgi:PST family polysaccharide transporter